MTRTVAENTPSGDVGAPVTATDADNDTLTYTVAAASTSQTDTAHLAAFNTDFALDAATGQITVKPGAAIDFETRPSYAVSYQVTDKKDAAAAADTVIDDSLVLTVTVTNANEDGAVAISGTVEAGQSLTASLSDPDGATASTSWQWSKAASGSNTYTDIATATSASYTVAIDDIAKVLKATATYTDTTHSATDQTASAVTAEVGAANSDPQFADADDNNTADPVTRTVAENTPSGDVGAPVTATDADNDTLTYTVAAASTSQTDTAHLAAFNTDFALDAATGQITVKPGAAIDFETRPSYAVSYQVTDKKDAAAAADTVIDDSLVLTVTVTNANEDGAVAISGTVEAGQSLTASLSDPDGATASTSWQWSKAASGSNTYTDIATATSASYTVAIDDIAVVLKATATYTDTTHSATDQTASAVTAEVGAANSDPQFADADDNNTADPVTRTVAENTPSGDVGAPVTATDADNDTLTYTVAAASTSQTDTAHLAAFNTDFALDAATGQITVKPGAAIDFETRPSYAVSYQVTDKKDAAAAADTVIDDSLVLTVTVTNANEDGAVAISGTVEAGQSLTASLSDPDGATASTSWQWSKAASGSNTYTDIATATSASYTVAIDDIAVVLKATATYTDTTHSATDQTASAVTAEVGAANSDPQFADADDNNTADPVTRTVAENTPSGDVGAPVTATDADNDTLTYTVAAASTSQTDTAHLAAFNTDFALDAATGQITVKPGAAIDFETRPSYAVSYQVTDKKDAAAAADTVIDDSLVLTVTVTNANEDGAVAISGTVEAGQSLTASLSDPDGATASTSWQWSKAASGSNTYTDIATATSASYTVAIDDIAVVLKATATYTDTTHSATDQTASAVTAEVGAANSDPQFADADDNNTADPVTRTVAENTPSGDVGAPVTATDADNDTLTYTVAAASTSQTDTAHLAAFNTDFALDAATGQITVKPGAAIDFETRPSYAVSYQVTDKKDAAAAADAVIDDSLVLTVTVTNANEDGAVAISGTVEAGQSLTASLSDPDGATASTSWQWSKAASGSNTYTDIATATSASYTVAIDDIAVVLKATATYTDTTHSATDQTASAVTAEVGAANSDPQFADADDNNTADPVTRTVAENTPSGDVGAPVTATDADNDTLTYTVAAASTSQTDTAHLAAFNTDFALDAATGQITVKPGAAIDFETRPSYAVSYQVTDKKDAAAAADAVIDDSLVLTVTVTNANEDGAVAISGTVEAGQSLTASLSDPDGATASTSWQWSKAASGSNTYTDIATATSASYTVAIDDIAVVLKATATYTDTTHSATDQTASAVTAEVGAANSDPQFADADDNNTADPVTRTVAENTPSGDVGAPVTATDADNDTLTYTVAAASTSQTDTAHLAAFNTDFALDAATGQITVKPGAAIDFETRPSYAVSYQVTDKKDAAAAADTVIDDSLVLTVTVTNANEDGAVAISGTVEAGQSLTASLSDPDGATASTSWQWSKAASGSNTYTDIATATSASYTVAIDDIAVVLKATATYTDTTHSATDQTASAVTAEVGAANSDPQFADADDNNTADPVTRTVAENTPSGDVGAPVTATDADNDTLTYTVAAASTSQTDTAHLAAFNTDFALDAATGQITVKPGAAIDFETRPSYAVSYQVTDKKDAAAAADTVIDDSLVLTVTVTNANEDGAVAISGTVEAGQSLTASLSDPDGATASTSWQWSKAASGSNTYTDIATATSASYTVAIDDIAVVLKATATYTDTTHSATDQTASAVTAEVGAANSDPQFADADDNNTADPVTRTVAENTPSGDVGAPVTATDADNDTLTYTVAAASTSQTDTAHLAAFNTDFALDAATGQITVKPGAAIDFETRPSYAVSYQVTDKKDAAAAADTVIDDSLVLTVTVTNANEDGAVAISGTVEAGQSLTASLSDPDGATASTSWQWSKAASGSNTYTDIATATSASYTVAIDDIAVVLKATATYTDTTHSATDQTASAVTAEVGAANSDPQFADADDNNTADPVTRTVAENTPSGDVGAPVTATDADNDTLTYTVAAASTSQTDTAHLAAFNTDFALDAATGQITVKPGAAIDFETRPSYAVSYQVTDKKDAAAAADTVIDDSLVLTVTVTNANEDGAVAISGTVEAGQSLTASLSDPDGATASTSWQWSKAASGSNTYTDIATATSASYTVAIDDIAVVLKATATYTDTTHSATDQTASAVTAEVGAANSDPQFADADDNNTADPVTRTVAENTPSGDVGAPVTATDADNDTLTYTVAAASTSQTDTAHLAAFNTDFALDAATGQITVKPGAAIDFETRPSYAVSYQVTDKKDAAAAADTVIDDSLVLTVTVTNANEDGAVAISGTVEAGQSLTASLSDPDGATASTSWQWSKAASGSNTYTDIATATSASYTVAIDDIAKMLKATATYTDTTHSATDQTASAVTAEVGAANSDPQFADADDNNTADPVTRTVAENTPSGDVGAPVTATDADNDTLTYTVAAASTSQTDTAHLAAFNTDFALDAATGQITVKPGAAIDFETRPSYAVSYQVTDKKDAAAAADAVIDDSLVLTVTVTNANEDGAVAISGTVEAGQSLTASLSDPDGATASTSWQWSKAASGSNTYTDIATATSASYTVAIDDIAKMLKATATYTDTTHSATDQTASAVTAEVGAANSDPQFADADDNNTADPVTRTVAENTPSGDVGAPVTATDADNDTLTYTVAAASTSQTDTAHLAAFNTDFALDAATGQITVKPGAAIDFETRPSYAVSYQVTDKKDAAAAADTVIDDRVALTVNVTDIAVENILSIDDVTVTEATGGVTAEFTVSLSPALTSGVAPRTVAWTTAVGTATDTHWATSATDFTAGMGTLTFNAGDTSKTIQVAVNDDMIDEWDEKFLVTLSSAQAPLGFSGGATTLSGTATITDNDVPEASLSGTNQLEVSEGEAVTFTIELDIASSRNLAVVHSTVVSPIQAATSSTDFTAISGGKVEIAAGNMQATVEVSTTQDAIAEADELFLFRIDRLILAQENLSDPEVLAGTTSGANGSALILDDEPRVVIDSTSSAAENVSGGKASVPVRLVDRDNNSTTYSDPVTVTWSTGAHSGAAHQAAGGTSTDPAHDYVSVSSGMLTIAANSSSGTAQVTLSNDALDEYDETFAVSISGASANAHLGDTSKRRSVVTITDDDPLPEVSVAAASAAEGDTVALTVSLGAVSGRDIVVQYATQDHAGGTHQATAGDSNDAGRDYTSVSAASVMIEAGQSSASVSVATREDSTDEHDETFELRLTGASTGGTQVGDISTTAGTAVGTITDDDDMPLLSISDASAPENADPAVITFTVGVAPASGKEVTVEYETADGSDNPGGSATAGEDYTATSGTLTFVPGDTEMTIMVALSNDSAVEGAEVFTVTLSNPTNAELPTSPDDSATGTISNDDHPPRPRPAGGGGGSDPEAEETAETGVGFTDVNPASVHMRGISALAKAGVTSGCSAEPFQFCPNMPVTQAQMATFLVRALELAPAEPAGFADVGADNVHAASIDALTAAGITDGCGVEPSQFCPDQPVTRAQMATFLVRALELAPAEPAGFADVGADNVHAASIDALTAAGITDGCGVEPFRFCPDQPVTRAQMATFLTRALKL